MVIGKKIERYRKEKGFTQTDMAVKLDISENTYRKYEKDISSISIETLQKIADFLDKNIFDFFPEENTNFYISENYGGNNGYIIQNESIESINLLLIEKDRRIADKEFIISQLRETIESQKKTIEKFSK